MISLILLAIAAICNAVMDSVENEHVHDTVFRDMNKNFWWKRVSHDKAKRIFKWKYDAWHVFKSIMIVLFVLAMVFYQPIVKWWVDFIIYGVVWNVFFNISYNKVFKR